MTRQSCRMRSVPFLCSDSLVEGCHFRGLAFWCECGEHVRAPGCSQRLAKGRPLDQVRERGRQLVDCAWRHQQAVDTIAHDLRNPTGPVGDDGYPHRERFRHNETERLLPRRNSENVEVRVDCTWIAITGEV